MSVYKYEDLLFFHKLLLVNKHFFLFKICLRLFNLNIYLIILYLIIIFYFRMHICYFILNNHD